MVNEMQIESLIGEKILVNCNSNQTKISICICTARYSGIQIPSNSQFEFVLRDTKEFESLDFD